MESIMYFLLAGIVPGTSIVLEPDTMLALYAAAFTMVIGWVLFSIAHAQHIYYLPEPVDIPARRRKTLAMAQCVPATD